jgi:hypothetical protein
MAYTRTNLCEDIARLNKRALLVCPYQFHVRSSNGYTGIDLYKGDSCLHVIATGTPKDCLAGARALLLDYALTYIERDITTS